jgi:hypothetical protein
MKLPGTNRSALASVIGRGAASKQIPGMSMKVTLGLANSVIGFSNAFLQASASPE